jgi:hypothetical protein
MTLVIPVGTGDRVAQAVDRRLTWDSGRYDDTSNKAVVVECSNGRFALGYTGLGRVGGTAEPTDIWALRVLQDAPTRPVREVLAQLAAEAAKVIDATPGSLGDKDLTFVGVGFFDDGRSLAFTSSNVLDKDGKHLPAVSRQFSACIHEGRPHFVGAFGLEDAARTVVERLHAQLNSGILSRLPGAALADLLVDGIREAAADPSAGGAIGRDCMSVVLERDASIPALARYHSQDRTEPNTYLPHRVSRIGTIAGTVMRNAWTDSPSASVPFHEWPELPVVVAVTNEARVFRVTHKGSERLSDVTLVVSDEAVDCGCFAEGFWYVPGFVKRVSKLDPAEAIAIPVDAFQDMRTGQTLDHATAQSWYFTVVARLPNDEFGRTAAPVSELLI